MDGFNTLYTWGIVPVFVMGLMFNWMEKLAAEHGGAMDGFDWISTNPVTSERVKNARDAAAE